MNTQPNIRLKKELVGVVISDKMEKTVVVQTDRRMVHPDYDKVVNISKTYKAHDESNERKIGDVVRIRQSRPLSKTKRWVVIETVSQSTQQNVKTSAASTGEKASTKAKTKTKTTTAKKATKRAK